MKRERWKTKCSGCDAVQVGGWRPKPCPFCGQVDPIEYATFEEELADATDD